MRARLSQFTKRAQERERGGRAGREGREKKKATSRSVFYLSRREKAISHASRCLRVRRSPIRAQMHAGYVVLRVPCAKGYWTWPKGHCSCAASLRSFSVRSLHTPVVTLAKASRYHCVARLGTRAGWQSKIRAGTRSVEYMCKLLSSDGRPCARPLKIGLVPTLWHVRRLMQPPVPDRAPFAWTARKFYSKPTRTVTKRIFPFSRKKFHAIFKCEQFWTREIKKTRTSIFPRSGPDPFFFSLKYRCNTY